MMIADYIKKKEYESTAGILQEEKTRIYEAAKNLYNNTNSKYEELEEFLNGYFYENNEGKIAAREIDDKILKAYENKTGQYILGDNVTWDMNQILATGAQNLNSTSQANFKKAKKYGEQGRQETQIYVSTLQQYYNTLEAIIKSQKFANVQLESQKLQGLITSILNEYNIETQKIIRNTKTKSFLFSYIKDKFNEILKTIQVGPASLGKIFEYGLAGINGEVGLFAQMTTEKLIDEFVLGDKSVKREGTDVAIVFDTGDKPRAKKDLKFTGKNSLTIGGVEIKTDFSDSRMGKADVIVHLPSDPKSSFKISAKNWAGFNIGHEHGFGETSIMAAVARSNPSDSVLQHFLYAMGPREANENQIQAFHDYAKMCLALDILIGYSQRSFGGTADTIVINNRQEKKIYVYSGQQLIDEATKKEQGVLSFAKYSESELRETAKKFLEERKRWGNFDSNRYKANLINKLSELKISIMMNSALKNNKS